MLALLVVLKRMGVPLLGQIIKAISVIINTPILGSALKTLLGANSRVHYKISSAIEHKPLRDYWNPHKCCCCGGPYDAPTKKQDDAPFPYIHAGQRGTPPHVPVTKENFEDCIFANERGGQIDKIVNVANRGFKYR